MATVMATPEFQNGTWTIAHVTSNLTLVSGLICLLVGVLRLGILFDFICQPAIAGFMAGSGLTIVVNQVRKEMTTIKYAHSLTSFSPAQQDNGYPEHQNN
jgi:sodium-independent sulfate anion transporter 11